MSAFPKPSAAPATGGLWARAGLVCSAMVLSTLLAIALVRSGAPASAGMVDLVASAGDFAMLTTDGGSDDVLVVLDQRSESLLLYRVANQQRVEFYGRQSLKDLFTTARAMSGEAPAVPAAPEPASAPR